MDQESAHIENVIKDLEFRLGAALTDWVDNPLNDLKAVSESERYTFVMRALGNTISKEALIQGFGLQYKRRCESMNLINQSETMEQRL